MEGRLRFLQTSDWALDVPLHGIAVSSPDQNDDASIPFKSLLANARYRAAEKLIQTALTERVDFVLLAGNIQGTPLPGSRAPWFMAEQLKRLQAARIPVIWAENSMPAFTAGLTLPANVQFFTEMSRPRELFLRLRRGTIRVVRETELIDPLAADFTIALTTSDTTRPVPRHPGRIDFIASSGTRRAINNQVACSGPPQAYGFHQSGPQGCLIVDSVETACEVRFVPTDSVRWAQENVSINSATTWDALENALVARQRELAETGDVDLLVVKWDLSGYGPLWDRLVSPVEQFHLLQTLRNSARQSPTPLWVTGLELTPDATQVCEWRSESRLKAVVQTLDQWKLSSTDTLDIPQLTGIVSDVPQDARLLEKHLYSGHTELLTLCRAVHEISRPESQQVRAA